LPEAQAASRGDILRTIVAAKRREIEALVPRAGALERSARNAPPARDFAGALVRDRVAVIAEVKRRSPGAGEIRPGLRAGDLARSYQEAGAAALSVLTDRAFFGGSLDDLRSARSATGIPALRKDFVLDPVQVLEARAAGADAILLIVRILEDGPLRQLRELAESLGMTALVEVHSQGELERAVASGARIVGVNNRDLRTFRTDLDVTEELLPLLPPTGVLVSESGIRTGSDVARLGRAGVHAVLVGESILRAPDPAEQVRLLAAHPRAERP
jgi:indole-3-glycerol phosphate synthase